MRGPRTGSLRRAYRDFASRRRRTRLALAFSIPAALTFSMLHILTTPAKDAAAVIAVPFLVTVVDAILSEESRRHVTVAVFLGTLFGVGLKWILETI